MRRISVVYVVVGRKKRRWKMNAWIYHTTLFMDDIRKFFISLEHGPRERNIGDGIVRDPNYSFHVADLLFEDGRPNHLSHIPQENQAYFATSLTYVVLLNQIVHSHFRNIHNEFWNRTRYPLVAGGLNPSRSPYAIFDDEIWMNRGIVRETLIKTWDELLSHIKEDISSVVQKQAPEICLTWEAFRDAAIQDHGVVAPEPWGSITHDNLV